MDSNNKNSEKSGVYNLDEALEETGYGKYHILVVILCGFCILGSVIETFGVSLLLPAAECELNMTNADKGLINGAGFLGIVLSAYMWGFLSDTWGRNKVMRLCLVSSSICTVISSFSVSVPMMITLRFFSGFLISGNSSTPYAYLGEFYTNRRRSRAITTAAIFQALGLVFIPVLALIVIPQKWILPVSGLEINFSSWRVFLILCSATNMLIFSVFYFMPESPKFLLVKGKHEEALQVLQTIFKYNTNKKRDDYPVKKINVEELIPTINTSGKNILSIIWEQTAPIFRQPFLQNTFHLVLVAFILAGTSAGLFMWIPFIFNDILSYHEPSMTLCQSLNVGNEIKYNATLLEESTCVENVDTTSFVIIAIAGMVFSFGFFLIAVLINKFEKRNMLIFTMVCASLTSIAIVWTTNLYAIIILMVATVCIGVAQAFISAFCVDIYPTNIRAMALCIILMFARLGSVSFSNIFGFMLNSYCDGVFYLIFGLLIFNCFTFVVPFLLKRK